MFLSGCPDTEFTVTINGSTIDGVRSPVTKERTLESMKRSISFHGKAYKTIVFNNKRKYSIVVRTDYINPDNLKVSQFQAQCYHMIQHEAHKLEYPANRHSVRAK